MSTSIGEWRCPSFAWWELDRDGDAIETPLTTCYANQCWDTLTGDVAQCWSRNCLLTHFIYPTTTIIFLFIKTPSGFRLSSANFIILKWIRHPRYTHNKKLQSEKLWIMDQVQSDLDGCGSHFYRDGCLVSRSRTAIPLQSVATDAQAT